MILQDKMLLNAHAGPNVSRSTDFGCLISKESGENSVNPEKQKDLQLWYEPTLRHATPL